MTDLLSIEGLRTAFRTSSGEVAAVVFVPVDDLLLLEQPATASRPVMPKAAPIRQETLM